MFPSELIALALYVAQQLGILLGVGSATILLIHYLSSLHATQTSRVEHGVEFAQYSGLGVIVVSGFGATVYHILGGQMDVVLAPAFLFKWILLSGVIAFALISKIPTSVMSRSIVVGLLGAQWYAVLLIHGAAPIVGWGTLLALYGSWMVVCMLGWSIFVTIMYRTSPAYEKHVAERAAALQKERAAQAVVMPKVQPVIVAEVAQIVTAPVHVAPAAAPKVPMPVAAPAPVVVAVKPVPTMQKVALTPVVVPLELTAPHPHAAPAPRPHMPAAAPMPPKKIMPLPAPMPVLASAPPPPPTNGYELPALWIMPQTPEDIAGSTRGPVVQFN
jgi:hypothetical protein